MSDGWIAIALCGFFPLLFGVFQFALAWKRDEHFLIPMAFICFVIGGLNVVFFVRNLE